MDAELSELVRLRQLEDLAAKSRELIKKQGGTNQEPDESARDSSSTPEPGPLSKPDIVYNETSDNSLPRQGISFVSPLHLLLILAP